MNTDQASSYLKEWHGLPVEPKTMRNWRAAGRGPPCKYLGITPIYDRPVLDDWAENEALTEENPISRTRRLAKEARDLRYHGSPSANGTPE